MPPELMTSGGGLKKQRCVRELWLSLDRLLYSNNESRRSYASVVLACQASEACSHCQISLRQYGRTQPTTDLSLLRMRATYAGWPSASDMVDLAYSAFAMHRAPLEIY